MKFKKIVLTSLITISALTISNVLNRTQTLAMKSDSNGNVVIGQNVQCSFCIGNDICVKKLDENRVKVTFEMLPSKGAPNELWNSYIKENSHLFLITTGTSEQEINFVVNSVFLKKEIVLTAIFDLDTLERIKNDKNCKLLLRKNNFYMTTRFHEAASEILSKINKK